MTIKDFLFIIMGDYKKIFKVNLMNRKSRKQYTDDVKRVIAFFEKNCNKNIRFSDVMNISRIGETNFKRYFKEITGFSVMNYFKKIKINKAKELIRKDCCSFTQISVILGYETVHYFSRQFKTIEGISPTEYKLLLKKEQE